MTSDRRVPAVRRAVDSLGVCAVVCLVAAVVVGAGVVRLFRGGGSAALHAVELGVELFVLAGWVPRPGRAWRRSRTGAAGGRR